MTFKATQAKPQYRTQVGLCPDTGSNQYCLHHPRTWGMAFLLLLPALRAAHLVHATLSTSCVSSNFTINSVSDAASLANCSTLFGDVVIGNINSLTVDISGPTHINGDLIMENNRAMSLCSISLTSITGTLALTNNEKLYHLTMPALTRVGSIHFQSSPVKELDFGGGIVSVGSVYIDDTGLRSVDSLDIISVDELTVTNNLFLNQIYLPNLSFAGALSISGIRSFEAPQLGTIGGLARFDGYWLASLTIPALESSGDLIITGTPPWRRDLSLARELDLINISLPSLNKCNDLIITDVRRLEDISFPRLKAVNGKLSITHNIMLAVIDFDDLTTVGADVKIRGHISRAQFPGLQAVGGNFEMSSANDISDSCDDLKRLAPVSQCGDGHIHGTFTCLSNNEYLNKDYCANSSSHGNTGVRGKKGSVIVGLALALFPALIL